MRILGISADGNYIAEVTHTEVEKVFDKYYGKLDKLKPGQSIALDKGYDFRSEIQSACKGMTDANKNFGRAAETLQKFAIMVGQLPVEPEEEVTL